MSAGAATVVERTTAAPGGGRFTGAVTLLRLYLRLDRNRIAVWALAYGVVFYGSVIALRDTFPDAASLQSRAQFGDNPVNRVIGGPSFGVENYTLDAVVANELSMFALLLGAIMTMTITMRHTRTEEESGRMETVRALPVGRDAANVAAFAVVAVAGAAVGLAIVLGLLAGGLGAAGAALFGAAVTATVLVFAAVAVLAAQIVESARTATSIAMAALGVVFLIRAAGDVMQDGGSWLSWLSPLAWPQQTRIYADMRWWPLGLSVVLAAALVAAAFVLSRRRDLGAGLRAARPGPEFAAAGLPSPIGLATRLLRPTALAWLVGVLAFGLIMGALVDAVGEMVAENEALDAVFAIDSSQLYDSFAAAIVPILMTGPVAQIVSSALRWREEETSGRISDLIVAGHSRTKVLVGWSAVSLGYATASVLALGAGVGIGMFTVTGDAALIPRIGLLGALTYLPAVLVIGGVAVALIGWAPARAGLGYVLVMWVVLVAWLGELLGLPSWLRNLSPVELIPDLPLETLNGSGVMTLLGLTLAAVALGYAALSGVRRRDLLA